MPAAVPTGCTARRVLSPQTIHACQPCTARNSALLSACRAQPINAASLPQTAVCLARLRQLMIAAIDVVLSGRDGIQAPTEH
jgi:hypothetical protein